MENRFFRFVDSHLEKHASGCDVTIFRLKHHVFPAQTSRLVHKSSSKTGPNVKDFAEKPAQTSSHRLAGTFLWITYPQRIVRALNFAEKNSGFCDVSAGYGGRRPAQTSRRPAQTSRKLAQTSRLDKKPAQTSRPEPAETSSLPAQTSRWGNVEKGLLVRLTGAFGRG